MRKVNFVFGIFIMTLILGYRDSYASMTAEEPCLAALSLTDVKGIVCGTQGFISYIDFNGTKLSDPKNMKLTYLYKDGNPEGRTLENTLISEDQYGTNLEFKSGRFTIEFHSANFTKSPPDFGYVVIGGNSGSCAPVRSGTVNSCSEIVASQNMGKYGNFSLPEIIVPETKVDFLYSAVQLHPYDNYNSAYKPVAMSYPKAVEYCLAQGGRLPSRLEVLIEFERLSWKRIFFNTAFPNAPIKDGYPNDRNISDPGLLAEFHDMTSKGFKPYVKWDKSTNSWVMNFYINPNTYGWHSSMTAEIKRSQHLPYGYVRDIGIFLNSESVGNAEDVLCGQNGTEYVRASRTCDNVRESSFVCVKDKTSLPQ